MQCSGCNAGWRPAVASAENVELAEHQVGALPPGRFARLTVQDSGVGMPADVATGAIEPFCTTKPPGKGTDMGVSQVFGFAQQLDGEMVLDTAPRAGTSVFLYLPLAEDIQGREESAAWMSAGHTLSAAPVWPAGWSATGVRNGRQARSHLFGAALANCSDQQLASCHSQSGAPR